LSELVEGARLEIDILDEKFKGFNEKYFKYLRWGMINRPEVLFLKPEDLLGLQRVSQKSGQGT
jgi:hypothetical protein